MKFLISMFVVFIITVLVYFFLSKKLGSKKAYNVKKINTIALIYSAFIAICLLGFVFFKMLSAANAPDKQCSTIHAARSYSPANLTTAMDYFEQGNYEYDIGNCQKAIEYYTTSIKMNPKYPQAYNNRAYTLMRLRRFADALSDLNFAIELNPNYIQALMNRGDIHNYYFAIDRQSAVVDYEKIVSLGGGRGTSVCENLFFARHNGWNLGTILDIPFGLINTCK